VIWRATLRRGRVSSTNGRDRSASLQWPHLALVSGGPRSVVAVHPMPADATAARPSSNPVRLPPIHHFVAATGRFRRTVERPLRSVPQ